MLLFASRKSPQRGGGLNENGPQRPIGSGTIGSRCGLVRRVHVSWGGALEFQKLKPG